MSPRVLLVVSCALLVWALPLRAPSVLAGDEKPLEVRVNRAIDRSAAHLVSKRGEDGSRRKDDKHHPLGCTALSTYTLLHAGYPSDHPAVRKALAVLGITGEYGGWKKQISTYEAGCLTLMLNALGKKHAPQIREIWEWLVENFDHTEGRILTGILASPLPEAPRWK